MALSQQQKDAVFRRAMSRWSKSGRSCEFVKDALRAAVDDADAWMDANAGAYNQALSQPFRNAAEVEHKGLLLVYVVMVMAGLRPEDL